MALASARQFSGLVTLPTRPPLSMIWRRRQDSNPFASLRASSAPVLPVRFSKALRCRFRTHLHNPVRERRLELPSLRSGQALRPKAAVFKTACGCRFHHSRKSWCADRDSNPDACARRSQRRCMPVPASARTWSARRDSNPHRAFARCVLSAVRVPVPPRAETWKTTAELNCVTLASKAPCRRRSLRFPCRPQTGGLSRI